MIRGMSVLKTVILRAFCAVDSDNFLDFAALLRTFVDEDFSSVLLDLTIVVHVLIDCKVGRVPSF